MATATDVRRRALQRIQRLYKNNQLEQATFLLFLGDRAYDKRKYMKATENYRCALNLYDNGNHSKEEEASHFGELAIMWDYYNQPEEAMKCYKKAVEIKQALYSKSHPKLAAALSNLEVPVRGHSLRFFFQRQIMNDKKPMSRYKVMQRYLKVLKTERAFSCGKTPEVINVLHAFCFFWRKSHNLEKVIKYK